MAGGSFRNAAFACWLGVTLGFCPVVASSAPLAMVDRSHATIFDQALRDQSASEPGEDQLPPELRRQSVAYPTPEAPGTNVIDTPHTYLYYVLGGGRAIRYAIGAEMIERQPPGARAMYLGDTQFRIHSTNDPNTIGKKVSSGCVRLTNEDVIDLNGRTALGAEVVVLPPGSVASAFGLY